MSNPVGPKDFNPVLGASMVGVAATTRAIFGIVDAIHDHGFMKHRLVPECIKIQTLAKQTRDLLIAKAETFEREELQRGRRSLIEEANEMYAMVLLNFDPRGFAVAAREARAAGDRPEHLMWRWCCEIVSKPFWLIDRIQQARMTRSANRVEWREMENLKQDIVNLWGKSGFDVSRSEGREYSFLIRSALKAAVRWTGLVLLSVAIFCGGMVSFVAITA